MAHDSPSPSVQQARRDLGRRLSDIRKDAGLSARELASRAGWHESKCSRLQSGGAPPSDDDIRTWTTICGAKEQAGDLITAARGVEGMYVEWRRQNRAGLQHLQRSAIPLSERTTHFRIYEPGVIPGLLQTPGYATALLRSIIAFEGIPDDTEAAVAARIERQSVLHRDARTFAFLVEESALRARVADDDVMIAQYGHLIQMAVSPRVSIGIIPMAKRRSIWPVEGFWIYDDSQVLVELVTAEVSVTQLREIATYARTFEALADIAAHGAECRTLIMAAITALG